MKKNLYPDSELRDFISSFAERVLIIRRKSGLNQSELSQQLGRKKNNTISRIELGQATSVSFQVLDGLVSLAESLGYSAEWLLRGQQISPHVSIGDLEQKLKQTTTLHYISSISHDGPLTDEDWRKYAPPLTPGYFTVPPEDVPTSSDWSEKYVPVLGRIAAGEGEDTIEASDYPPAWAGEFLEYSGAPPTAVAVRVKGKSMQPEFRDGDMVIVDPAQSAEASEVCCVLLNRDGIRESRLKTFKKSAGWIILESINPDFPPERISVTAFAAAYKIIKHLPLIVHS